MIKLSVIIPVYNVEMYLPACLESVLSLQSDEVEFICVAGMSRDRSTEILRQYAVQDERITILEQPDTGLSEARNQGAAAAVGEYLLFVDSDDFVRPPLLRRLFQEIKAHPRVDVIVTDFSKIYTQDDILREKPVDQIEAQNDGTEGMWFLPRMLKRKQCFWNVWRYVYRRGFLQENNILFRNGYMCEDVDYTTQVLTANPRILFLHCPFYCYRVAQKNSMMGHTTSRNIHDTVAVLSSCIMKLRESDFVWKKDLIEQYQFELILTLARLYEVPKAERAQVVTMFYGALPLLDTGDYKTAKTVHRICSIAGVKAVAYCLFLLKKLKRKSRTKWVPYKEAACSEPRA